MLPEIVNYLARSVIFEGSPVVLTGALLLLEGVSTARAGQVVIFHKDTFILVTI